ncbi:putative aquaporin 1 [Mycena rebaudengoi]|nr:putative aquaporin 1 [Mycena rebaudengoi]
MPAQPQSIRNDLAAALLELVGTMFFLMLGLGGIQASTGEKLSGSDVEQVLYISTSMGLSLLVSAWLFYRVSGGLFNPCITIALALLGILTPIRCGLYCLAQFSGSILASALLLALTTGRGERLAVNTFLQPDITPVQGVFIEMFITSALVISVLMLAAEKHQATAFAPIGIGLTLFSCHLWAAFYTGASMNTARSFGPALVTGFPTSHHWVYWIGPFLGSLLGSAFYAVLKHYKYWTLNPDQATSDPTKSPDDPVELARTLMEENNLGLNPRALVGQTERIPILSGSDQSSSTLELPGPLKSAV